MINLFILLISNLPRRQMISVNFGPIYQQYFIHLTLRVFFQLTIEIFFIPLCHLFALDDNKI